MVGLGGLAGLSGAYSGYNEGVGEEATARAKKYAIDMQQAGDAAFGRTLMMLNQGQQGGQQMPGQQPMGPPPGGAPPMPPPGQPPAPPPQMPMQQGQPQPMPQARPPMPMQAGGGQPPPMPQQPMGGPPAGPPQMPGGGQPGMQQNPALDWRVVFQKVQQANPGAPPQVLAAAVDRFLPLMNQQAQMQWREVSQQLRAMQIQQGQERVNQGEERIRGAEANLGERQREFDTREKRLESSAAIRQDQGWQRLEIQKQQLERQITEGKNKQLLGQWRAVVDAQHKRAMEIIQSSSGFSAMDPKEKKALLDEQNKAYNEAIERMRDQMGSSTGSGGTSDMPGPKAQEAAPKSTAVPGATPKPGDVMDGWKFKGGDPADKSNWEKVSG